jgi:hypothetical protein
VDAPDVELDRAAQMLSVEHYIEQPPGGKLAIESL